MTGNSEKAAAAVRGSSSMDAEPQKLHQHPHQAQLQAADELHPLDGASTPVQRLATDPSCKAASAQPPACHILPISDADQQQATTDGSLTNSRTNLPSMAQTRTLLLPTEGSDQQISNPLPELEALTQKLAADLAGLHKIIHAQRTQNHTRSLAAHVSADHLKDTAAPSNGMHSIEPDPARHQLQGIHQHPARNVAALSIARGNSEERRAGACAFLTPAHAGLVAGQDMAASAAHPDKLAQCRPCGCPAAGASNAQGPIRAEQVAHCFQLVSAAAEAVATACSQVPCSDPVSKPQPHSSEPGSLPAECGRLPKQPNEPSANALLNANVDLGEIHMILQKAQQLLRPRASLAGSLTAHECTHTYMPASEAMLHGQSSAALHCSSLLSLPLMPGAHTLDPI